MGNYYKGCVYITMMELSQFSIDKGFWIGMGAVLLVVFTMLLVFWNLPPKEE